MTAPEIASQLAGLPSRFRIKRLLGSGAFGDVFQAFDEVLNRDVALKTLSRRTSSNGGNATLLAEARALANVAHPNVVGVLDVLSLPNNDVLVLEYVAGGTLSNEFEQEGSLDSAAVLHWLAGVSAGLASIHAAGLLHCDLKPDNVLIDGARHARISDFGLATMQDAATTKTVGGSLGYAAPEIVSGETATAASDLYSFGVIGWELLAGRRAFAASRTLEVLKAQLVDPLPPLSELAPDVPAEIRHVITQCLHPEPHARPHSTDDVATILAPYLLRSNRDGTRQLAGIGIVAVAPLICLAILLTLVLVFWLFPAFHASSLRPAVGRQLTKQIIAELGVAFAALVGIADASRAISKRRSGRANETFLAFVRRLFAAPAWWPTWYPGMDPIATVTSLPDTIQGFRFWVWWVLPWTAYIALITVVLALAPAAMVSADTARWVLASWFLVLFTAVAWLMNIVSRFKHSTVYDQLELVAVALFRAPVSDTALAFPPPIKVEIEYPETRWGRIRRWWNTSTFAAGIRNGFYALAFLLLLAWGITALLYRDPDFLTNKLSDAVERFVFHLLSDR